MLIVVALAGVGCVVAQFAVREFRERERRERARSQRAATDRIWDLPGGPGKSATMKR